MRALCCRLGHFALLSLGRVQAPLGFGGGVPGVGPACEDDVGLYSAVQTYHRLPGASGWNCACTILVQVISAVCGRSQQRALWTTSLKER